MKDIKQDIKASNDDQGRVETLMEYPGVYSLIEEYD